MPFAEKAMEIYLKSREKVPVFPLQWLILETDYKLPGHVKKFVNFELKYRKMVRNFFKSNELEREEFEDIIVTEDKDSEVRYECYYCINLCYASFLKCSECQKHYCTSHGLVCGCPPERVKLYIRYTDEELLAKVESSKKH